MQLTRMSSSGSWGSDMWQPGKLDNSFCCSCSWLAVHKNRKTKLILSTQGRRWGRQREREGERREWKGRGSVRQLHAAVFGANFHYAFGHLALLIWHFVPHYAYDPLSTAHN